MDHLDFLFGKQKVSNEKQDSWSDVMTDACAKEFVDSIFVNEPNCITLIQAGREPPLSCEDISISQRNIVT